MVKLRKIVSLILVIMILFTQCFIFTKSNKNSAYAYTKTEVEQLAMVASTLTMEDMQYYLNDIVTTPEKDYVMSILNGYYPLIEVQRNVGCNILTALKGLMLANSIEMSFPEINYSEFTYFNLLFTYRLIEMAYDMVFASSGKTLDEMVYIYNHPFSIPGFNGMDMIDTYNSIFDEVIEEFGFDVGSIIGGTSTIKNTLSTILLDGFYVDILNGSVTKQTYDAYDLLSFTDKLFNDRAIIDPFVTQENDTEVLLLNYFKNYDLTDALVDILYDNSIIKAYDCGLFLDRVLTIYGNVFSTLYFPDVDFGGDIRNIFLGNYPINASQISAIYFLVQDFGGLGNALSALSSYTFEDIEVYTGVSFENVKDDYDSLEEYVGEEGIGELLYACNYYLSNMGSNIEMSEIFDVLNSQIYALTQIETIVNNIEIPNVCNINLPLREVEILVPLLAKYTTSITTSDIDEYRSNDSYIEDKVKCKLLNILNHINLSIGSTLDINVKGVTSILIGVSMDDLLDRQFTALNEFHMLKLMRYAIDQLLLNPGINPYEFTFEQLYFVALATETPSSLEDLVHKGFPMGDNMYAFMADYPTIPEMLNYIGPFIQDENFGGMGFSFFEICQIYNQLEKYAMNISYDGYIIDYVNGTFTSGNIFDNYVDGISYTIVKDEDGSDCVEVSGIIATPPTNIPDEAIENAISIMPSLTFEYLENLEENSRFNLVELDNYEVRVDVYLNPGCSGGRIQEKIKVEEILSSDEYSADEKLYVVLQSLTINNYFEREFLWEIGDDLDEDYYVRDEFDYWKWIYARDVDCSFSYASIFDLLKIYRYCTQEPQFYTAFTKDGKTLDSVLQDYRDTCDHFNISPELFYIVLAQMWGGDLSEFNEYIFERFGIVSGLDESCGFDDVSALRDAIYDYADIASDFNDNRKSQYYRAAAYFMVTEGEYVINSLEKFNYGKYLIDCTDGNYIIEIVQSSDVVIPNTAVLDGIEYTVIGIGKEACWENQVIRNISFPSSLKYIDDKAFYHAGLRSICFEENGENCTRIGEEAFYDCYSLQYGGTLVLPKGLEELGEEAFYETYITALDFNGCNLKSIPYLAFFDNKLEGIIIPEGIEEIGDYAFASGYTKYISIPKTVKKMGVGIFDGGDCMRNIIEDIEVDSENENYKVVDGTLYELNEAGELYRLMQYPSGIENTELVIPEGVEVIAEASIEYAQKLNKIVFPKSLKTIENWGVYYITYAAGDGTFEVVLYDTVEVAEYGFFDSSCSKVTLIHEDEENGVLYEAEIIPETSGGSFGIQIDGMGDSQYGGTGTIKGISTGYNIRIIDKNDDDRELPLTKAKFSAYETKTFSEIFSLVKPTYTITIPALIEVGSEEASEITCTLRDSQGYNINVSAESTYKLSSDGISSADSPTFKLVVGENTFNNSTKKELVHSFLGTQGISEYSVNVSAEIDTAPKYPGEYKGQMTYYFEFNKAS